MKKIYLFVLSLLTFLAVVINVSFIPKDGSSSPPVTQKVSLSYHAGLDEFEAELQQFVKEAELLKNTPASIASFQKNLLKLRLKYKKIEFLGSYLDPEFVEDYINGPPLPVLERNAPSLSVVEPEGLQVLEELVFSEEPFLEKETIIHLSNLLSKNFSSFSQFQKKVHISDRHIFEAVRMQLVRIFNLGLTGFDSPVALNSIPEAAVSMEASFDAFSAYLPLISEVDKELANQLDLKFKEGIAYLNENRNFDSFDRLYFLKQFINPLYKLTLQAHLTLGVETIYEVTRSNQKHAVNYYAENLFDENFLDPFFFSDLQKEKYGEQLVELGRMLFFDPILSSNNQRSCASCHDPDKGFTDGFEKSKAFDHKGTLARNAPTLINSIYADHYFYDLRADVLENQIEHVLVDKKEFHTNYLDVFEKLNQSDEYVQAFKKAFPEVSPANPVMKHTLSAVLSAYVISLSGFNSPFDRYVRGESSELDIKAIQGFNVFMGKAGCGTCHFAPTFNGLVPPHYQETESEVLGVPASAKSETPIIDPDPGRYKGILKEEAPIYKNSFKTTTVRNVELTAPYMHNGVFQTLEEVIDFYDNGGGIGLGMDVPNQTLPASALGLSALEKEQLIAFMQSLTDTTGMSVKPLKLPEFADKSLNERVIGGTY